MSQSAFFASGPINVELFTRCAVRVNEWYGIDHAKNCIEATPIPAEVGQAKVALYNAVHDREYTTDEMFAALAFKAIVSAQQKPEPSLESIRKQNAERTVIVSLVPRILRVLNTEDQEKIEAQL